MMQCVQTQTMSDMQTMLSCMSLLRDQLSSNDVHLTLAECLQARPMSWHVVHIIEYINVLSTSLCLKTNHPWLFSMESYVVKSSSMCMDQHQDNRSLNVDQNSCKQNCC